jgi:hypothetical protein
VEWNGNLEFRSKFEAKWFEKDACEVQLLKARKNALEEGCHNLMKVQNKILGDLWEWGMNVLGELEKRIDNVKIELEKCKRKMISQESINQEHILYYKLECLPDQLNVYWKQ